MKLYSFDIAPNPARVVAYLDEKGIELEREVVNLLEGEQRSESFLKLSPAGTVPVLQLDDGECITESLAIIEYLEELYPEPPMIGRDALQRARTRAFERSVEMGVLWPIMRIVHATKSPLGLPPSPEVESREWARLKPALERLEARLPAQGFALGDAPTIVDCTLFAALQFAQLFDLTFSDYPKVEALYQRFKQRRTG